jgi:hypothetical protein
MTKQTREQSLEKALAARLAKGTRRRSRREKMAAFGETFARMRQQFPRMALPVIDKAEQGSLPAAVRLTCLDCSGWSRQEVRDCAIVACPLYPHRPFKPKG